MLDTMRREEIDREHINELRELLDKIITKNLNLGIDTARLFTQDEEGNIKVTELFNQLKKALRG